MRKAQRKFNSKKFKISANTALQASIVTLCNQTLLRRISVCWAILTKRYAKTQVGGK